MHIDDQIESRKSFIEQLAKNGWTNYKIKEEKTHKRVTIYFKLLNIVAAITILGLGFASMKEYLPRYYGYIALGLAVCWLMIERINLEKINNYLLKNARKELFSTMKEDSQLIEKIEIFECHGLIMDGTANNIKSFFEKDDSLNLIKEINKIIAYLHLIQEIKEVDNAYLDQ